jgi:hypothetical protein
VWKLTRSPSDAPEPRAGKAPVAAAPAPAAMPFSDPPPPPPPVAEEAAPHVNSSAPARLPTAKPQLVPPPMKSDPSCDSPCNGRETAELLSALGAKAGQARSCYEKALSNNGALAGRLEVAVRVSPTGSACSASIGKDGLGDAAVTSCLLSRFRSGKYPQPTGGCVDVSVPMNFMPAGSR